MLPKSKHPFPIISLVDLEAHPRSQHAFQWASGAGENHLAGAVPGCDSLFKELLAKGAAHGGHILLASTHQEVICHKEGSPSLLGFGFKQMGWCLATLWQVDVIRSMLLNLWNHSFSSIFKDRQIMKDSPLQGCCGSEMTYSEVELINHY